MYHIRNLTVRNNNNIPTVYALYMQNINSISAVICPNKEDPGPVTNYCPRNWVLTVCHCSTNKNIDLSTPISDRQWRPGSATHTGTLSTVSTTRLIMQNPTPHLTMYVTDNIIHSNRTDPDKMTLMMPSYKDLHRL